MIKIQGPEQLLDIPVVGACGGRLGRIVELLGDDPYSPVWAVVATRWRGRLRLVPLDGATFLGGQIHLGRDHRTVVASPEVALHELRGCAGILPRVEAFYARAAG